MSLNWKLKVVPDNPDKRVMQIKENKKVKHRTKIIFGTGENLQAITTTSNLHFVRASNSQVSSSKLINNFRYAINLFIENNEIVIFS